ncbi:Inorganic triphosphatase [subsurface metagenome]
MGKEIERRFLVKGEAWRGLGRGVQYRQGYLSTAAERIVRVRTAEGKGYLTVKGMGRGLSRTEFEYEIPFTDASAMLDGLCERPLIKKIRYRVEHCGMLWEVDEFQAENKCLILAEVELSYESQDFEPPAWLGKEVTHDPRYLNANLVKNPYKEW